LFSAKFTSLFNVPADLHGEASTALRVAAVTFVVNFLNSIFNTPQLTRLRMDLNTMVNAGFRILGQAVTPLAVYFGGILGGVLALFCASLLTLIGHLIVSRRINPHLFRRTIDRPSLVPLVKFGGAWLVASVAAMLLVNVEKGIVAAVTSPAQLAFYTVAFTLASMISMLSGAMIQSLIPAISQLRAANRTSQLESLFFRSLRINIVALLPVVFVLALIAKPFFEVWAGPEFGRQSTTPFYILLVGLSFNILAYVPHAVIMAYGRTDILAMVYWIELAMYAVLVWYLTSTQGIAGAAAAWSARTVIDATIQFIFARRVSKIGLERGQLPAFRLSLVFFIILIVVLPFFVALPVGLRVVAAVLVLAMYGIAIWRWLTTMEEKKWITAVFLARFRMAPKRIFR
jgi:O-antigen/teichoic acid export membrane protein